MALLIIWLTQPFTSGLTGGSVFTQLSQPTTIGWIFTTFLCTLLVASIYPGLATSSPRPVQALNGKNMPGNSATFLKKTLIVCQFGISCALVATTLLMQRQMNYIQQKDLGYNKDFVFATTLPLAAALHAAQIISELNHYPSVKSAGLASAPDLSDIRDNTGHIQWPGQPDHTLMMIGQLQVDQHFIPTMQYRLVTGRNFRGDSSDRNKYILNQTAVAQMGLKAPYIGQKISFHEKPGEIIGVLKDFNFKPLNEKITPILLYAAGESPTHLYVRANASDISQAIQHVKSVYDQFAGDTPFALRFLDDTVASHYQEQFRTVQLFNIFSCIAIFLSCMGLLGLISFAVQTRIKEIAMRKVLGASPVSLIKLLSRDFLILVFIGSLIFIPVAYLWVHHWLSDFAYKAPMNYLLFIISLAAVIIFSLLTISLQTIGAIRASPVQHLKSE